MATLLRGIDEKVLSETFGNDFEKIQEWLIFHKSSCFRIIIIII